MIYSLRSATQFARRSVAFTLFAVCFLTYAYFYQGGGQNEAARFDSIRAFLETGTLVVDPYVSNSADVILIDGHFYSSKAPGTFFIGLPFYAATDGVLRLFGVAEPVRLHWDCYVTTLYTIGLASAFLVVLIYWMGLRLKASRADAAAVALTIGLGTIFFPFATLFFSHAATAAFVFLGFYEVFAFVQDSRVPSTEPKEDENWRLLIGGFSLGFAITLEYPAVIASVLIGLYAIQALARQNRKLFWPRMGWFVGAGVMGLVALISYNLAAFHNPFYVTYEAYAQGAGKTFDAHKKGVLGIRIPLWDPDAWPLFLNNLKEITVKPLRGLFFCNPVLVFIFAGAALPFRRKWRLRFDWLPEIVFAAVMFAAYITLAAGFGDSVVYWGGGASFGSRHLITALPFLAILLHAALKLSSSRALFAPLAALSVFCCLMATAIEPRTPYSPSNPLFDYYAPKFLAGQLSINHIGIFSNVFLTDNSVAFNWGKLAGLPDPVQLLPLYLFWLGLAWLLDRQLEIRARGFFYVTMIFVLLLGLLPIGASAG